MERWSVVVVLVLVVSVVGLCRGVQEQAVEETRPIWVWGVPSWAGTYTPEMLEKSNESAKENFGITLKIESVVPAGMTQPQALQLVIAEGLFPDVAILGQLPNFDTIVEMAKQGRLLPLDKYFNDQERHPVWSSANRAYMRRYRWAERSWAFRDTDGRSKWTIRPGRG